MITANQATEKLVKVKQQWVKDNAELFARIEAQIEASIVDCRNTCNVDLSKQEYDLYSLITEYLEGLGFELRYSYYSTYSSAPYGYVTITWPAANNYITVTGLKMSDFAFNANNTAGLTTPVIY
jgi:hypothetical protein